MINPIRRRTDAFRLGLMAGLLGIALGALVPTLTQALVSPALIAIGLLAPLLVGLSRIRQSPVEGIVISAVSFVILLVYATRLTVASPGQGFIALAGMSQKDFQAAQLLGNGLLSLFGVSLALGLIWTPTGSVTGHYLDAKANATVIRRAGLLSTLGMLGGLFLALVGGPNIRDIASPYGLVQAVVLAATVAPAALVLVHRKILGALTLIGVVGAVGVGGGRQAILTPLAFFGLAHLASAGMSRTTTRRRSLRLVLVFSLAAASMGATFLFLTQSRTTSSVYQSYGTTESPVVQDEVVLDLMYVTLAREPRPQGFSIYSRTVAVLIPRVLWPNKPVSYDEGVRAKYFPAFGGGLPIGVVGTSYLSFLAPGVLLAGYLLGWLLKFASRSVAYGGPRSVLMGSALALFVIDVTRIGGLYRETTVLIPLIVSVMLIVPEGETSQMKQIRR